MPRLVGEEILQQHQREGAEMTWRESDRTPELGRLFSPYLEQRLGSARAASEPLERKHRDQASTMQADPRQYVTAWRATDWSRYTGTSFYRDDPYY